jgi:hypothetical protein
MNKGINRKLEIQRKIPSTAEIIDWQLAVLEYLRALLTASLFYFGHLKLYLTLLVRVRFVLVESRHTDGDRKVSRYQHFLACKTFHRFPGILKIILGVPPWVNCWETLSLSSE